MNVWIVSKGFGGSVTRAAYRRIPFRDFRTFKGMSPAPAWIPLNATPQYPQCRVSVRLRA